MSADLQNIELNCLLEAIDQHYGYDFKTYAQASLMRRVKNFMTLKGYRNVSELIPNILHDRNFFGAFLNGMSVPVTEMFRNPEMFRSLRKNVLPALKKYSRINIWHAGCATGEEAYSMAILLHEEGILERSQIYATDFNLQSLEIAKAGIYRANEMQKNTGNYLKSGGKSSFSDYYQSNYNSAKMQSALRKSITFANHNLMSDGVFAEMHLVMCRNVLIYFDKTLQDRVLKLFRDSLAQNAFLVLGDKETLRFSSVVDDFDAVDDAQRIFTRRYE